MTTETLAMMIKSANSLKNTLITRENAESLSNEMLKLMAKISNNLPRTRGTRAIESLASESLEHYVGTKAQYDQQFAKVCQELREQDEKNLKEAKKVVSELWLRVQKAVEENENVQNHPKVNLAWDMAWEYKNYDEYSDKYQQVVEIFMTLLDY